MWFMSQPVINVALLPSELENNLSLMGMSRVKVSKDKIKQRSSNLSDKELLVKQSNFKTDASTWRI